MGISDWSLGTFLITDWLLETMVISEQSLGTTVARLFETWKFCVIAKSGNSIKKNLNKIYIVQSASSILL